MLLHRFLLPECTDQERLIPTAGSRKPLRVWWVPHTSPQWILRAAFGRSKWPQTCNSILFLLLKILGFYEFTHMSIGLCNAPANFQHLMQNMPGELNLMYCIIYLDDMIVFGHTEEEHLEHLCIMFEQFCEFNLKLKPSKCSFFQLEIVYLAHHVS